MTDKKAEARSSIGPGEKPFKKEENEEEVILASVDMDREMRLVRRDVGADGVVLSLARKGDGFYEVFYSLDVNIGTPPTVFPLVLDTGSSDLWVASPDCGCASLPYSSSMSSTSTALQQFLNTTYLVGSFSGPLYTDTLSIGPYTLAHQAFCAATHVENQSTELGFSGIIGLGLGAIGGALSPDQGGSGNADGGGAPVLVNLFDSSVLVGGLGSTPTNRWFSLVLDRPGFDQHDIGSNSTTTITMASNSTTASTTWNHIWPARLGIGRHVDEVARAFFQASPGTSGNATAALEAVLQPLPLVPTPYGAYTHWKTKLSGITVYQGGGKGQPGHPTDIRLNQGVDGGRLPIAVLDSGAANVLASRAIADAVYGAWGIGMGSDGLYYVPCTQVMNITITLATLATSAPIPIHPLDMSTYPPNDPSADTCIGTIQVSSQLGIPGSLADVVLGISFLRNIYTVHKLDTPSLGNRETRKPRLAIAPLTNPVLALTEFENVRVLGLTPSGGGRTPPQPIVPPSSESMGTLSKIAIGIGSFLFAAVLLFITLCIVLRRRYHARRRAGITSHNVSEIGHGGGEGALGVDGVVDGDAEFAEAIRRETALREKKRKKKGLGGWGPPSAEWRENVDGLEGDAATRSATGHGSIRRGEPSELLDHVMASGNSMGGQGVDNRRGTERRGSGPVTGLSLRALVGALRVFRPPRSAEVKDGGDLYELSVKPVVHIHAGVVLDGEGEGGLTLADTGRAGWENASNVWSETTGVGRSHGTLVPTGAMGEPVNLHYHEFGERKAHAYPGTPDETVAGSTTRFLGSQNNEYRPLKDPAVEGASTIYGSREFGKGGGAGTGSHSKSSSASNTPLMGTPPDGGMASTSSLGSPAFSLGQAPRPTSRSQGLGHASHRSLPSLQLNLPPRLGSSGILTASPGPFSTTPGEDTVPFEPLGTPPRMIPSTPPSSTPPPLSATPPGIAPTPPRVPSSPTSYEGFNPFDVPTTTYPPPPPSVHPPKARMAVAIEPNLSPLTEVNSSELPSSTPNRVSIMSALTVAAAATVAQNAADAARMEPDMSGLERQSSVGTQSMESGVLVPLPISSMNLSSRWGNPPPPIEHLPTPVERRWCGPPPAQHCAPELRPSPVTVLLPLPPAQRMDASGSFPVQESVPLTHPVTTFSTLPPKPSLNTFYPRIAPTAVPPPARPPPSMPPAPNMSYDVLALNGGGLESMSKNSRFRSSKTPAPASSVPNYRPGQLEQHSLPIIDPTREEPRPPPFSRASEPSNSSLGMKSRRPRPMVAGPRSPKSSSDPGSTHSVPNSPPSTGIQSADFQSRYQTTYNSPLPSVSPSTPSIAPLTPESSLPPGARAPTDPRLHSHHQLPTIPRNLSSPPIPAPTAPAPTPTTPPTAISPPHSS